MSLEELRLVIVAIVAAAVFAALVREWCSPDIAALAGMGTLVVTGTLRSEDMLRVFSNHAPVTIAAMFVLGAALERVGAIEASGRLFARLGVAVEKTGAADLVARGAVSAFKDFGPVFMVALVYALTVGITALITNNTTAVLLSPLVIGIGRELGIDPRPLLVAVMFASSACFATPIGYQTNTSIYGTREMIEDTLPRLPATGVDVRLCRPPDPLQPGAGDLPVVEVGTLVGIQDSITKPTRDSFFVSIRSAAGDFLAGIRFANQTASIVSSGGRDGDRRGGIAVVG